MTARRGYPPKWCESGVKPEGVWRGQETPTPLLWRKATVGGLAGTQSVVPVVA
jgi:hypothetical protein